MDSNNTSQIILVTGGARSGKSSFAEQITGEIGKKIAYIATSIPLDEGMKHRIKKHRESRPKEWTTYEVYNEIYKQIEIIAKEHDTIILDCITVMITNIMFDGPEINWDEIPRDEIDTLEFNISNQIDMLIKKVRENNMNCILVTNEIGMGIVPESRLARIFRDIAGRINQGVAKKADSVYLVVSGIPVKIK